MLQDGASLGVFFVNKLALPLGSVQLLPLIFLKKMAMAYSGLHANLWLTTRNKQQWTYFSFFPKSF